MAPNIPKENPFLHPTGWEGFIDQMTSFLNRDHVWRLLHDFTTPRPPHERCNLGLSFVLLLGCPPRPPFCHLLVFFGAVLVALPLLVPQFLSASPCVVLSPVLDPATVFL